ncbi:MAG: HAD family hydrolase [Candidatus Limnocylindria bacterium]
MDGKRLAFEAGSAAGAEVDDARAEEIDRRAGMLFDRYNTRPRALPGAHDLLASLDETGVAWAIATSSRAEQVAASIAALDLSHPPRIVDGSRVAHAKPAPDLLLLAADELRVDPHATWYVGDSAWDMRAAVAAGMVPIAVTSGAAVGASDLREAGAAVVVETLEQLQLPD